MSTTIRTLDPQEVRARDLGSCLCCGRSYAGRAARPRWAFAHDGHLVGSVHTYHENAHGRSFPYWTSDGEQELETARFEVWRFRVHGRVIVEETGGTPHQSDEWCAFTLADGAARRDGQLSDRQTEQLEWWLSVGPMKLGEQRRTGILRAYHALLAQYRAWCATVPPDAPLPGRESEP